MPKKESDFEKVCALCQYASPLCEREEVLCRKYGVVAPDHTCRRFVYDPLKRVPRRPQIIPADLPDLSDL